MTDHMSESKHRLRRWLRDWYVTLRAQRRRDARHILRGKVTPDDFVEADQFGS